MHVEELSEELHVSELLCWELLRRNAAEDRQQDVAIL